MAETRVEAAPVTQPSALVPWPSKTVRRMALCHTTSMLPPPASYTVVVPDTASEIHREESRLSVSTKSASVGPMAPS